jgi:hypothetical protein
MAAQLRSVTRSVCRALVSLFTSRSNSSAVGVALEPLLCVAAVAKAMP